MTTQKNPLLRLLLERSPRGIVLRIAAWYLLLCGLLYLVQDDLVYHPTTMSRAEWHATAAKQGVQVLPDSLALVAEPTTAARSTVVLFHGNGENAMVRVWVAKRMAALGHRTVMAEYAGFGAREGNPSRSAMLTDGRALIADVRARYPGPLQIWGESMGTGPAAELAREEQLAGRAVQKVVLIVPFDKLSEVAQRSVPFVPARLLLKSDFDNSEALAKYPGIVDLVVADDDGVVGTDQGRQLRHNLAHVQGRYVEFKGGHNRWASFLSREHWVQMLDESASGRLGDSAAP